MKLFVNGVQREFPEPEMTVEALLAALDYSLPVFVVSLNGAVVESGDYTCSRVSDGDRIDIYNLIAGG